MDFDNLVACRVRMEFVEMPGLQLTLAQAMRLWGLDRATCEAIIALLVEAGFLRWTPAGTVVRGAEGFRPRRPEEPLDAAGARPAFAL